MICQNGTCCIPGGRPCGCSGLSCPQCCSGQCHILGSVCYF
jgi:hypothetical protein